MVTPLKRGPNGRPGKISRAVIDRAVEAIGLGATYALACNYMGVTYNTFRTWMLRGEAENERLASDPDAKADPAERLYAELARRVREAEGQAVIGWLSKIEAAADAQWQAAAWKLERRHPDEYSLNQKHRISGDSGDVTFEIRFGDEADPSETDE